jgi:hypothetical protein
MVFDVVERDESFWVLIDGAAVNPFLDDGAAWAWVQAFRCDWDDAGPNPRSGRRPRIRLVASTSSPSVA